MNNMQLPQIKFAHIFIACVVLASIANAGVTAEAINAKTFFEWAYLFGFEAVTLMLVFSNIRIYAEARQWFWLSVGLSIASRVGIAVVIYHQFEGNTGKADFWRHEVFSGIIAFAEILASLLSASAEVQLRELLTAETQKRENAELQIAELQNEVRVRKSRISDMETQYGHLENRYKFLLSMSGIAESEFRKQYQKSGNLLLTTPEKMADSAEKNGESQPQNIVIQNVVTVAANAELQHTESRIAESDDLEIVDTQSRIAEGRTTESRMAEIRTTETRTAEVRTAEVRTEEIRTAESEIAAVLKEEDQKSRIADLRDLEAMNAAARARLQAENKQSFSMKTTKTTTTETQEITLTAEESYACTYMVLPEPEMKKLIEAGMRAALDGQEFTRRQLMNFADKRPNKADRKYWQMVAKNEAYHDLRLPA